MWTKLYWAQILERAVKTFAQAAVAILTADQTGMVPLPTAWQDIAKVAGIAAAVSVFTSILSTPIGPGESPSLVAGPAESALDRLAVVARGLVNAVSKVPLPNGPDRMDRARSAALLTQKDRTVEVLADLGRAEP